MSHFFAFLGKMIVETVFVIFKIVAFVVRHFGWTLVVATVVTGWLAYRATDGRPWESSPFVYSIGALAVFLALRWGYRRLTSSSKL